jgi:hypothetical protein
MVTLLLKMDDRTKRRIEELEKIKIDGTSTEFDKGYQRSKEDFKAEIKQFLIDYEEETGNPLWMALNKWCDKE